MKPIATSAHPATMISATSPEERPNAAERDAALPCADAGATRAALPGAVLEGRGVLSRAGARFVPAARFARETRVGALSLEAVPPPDVGRVTVAGALGPPPLAEPPPPPPPPRGPFTSAEPRITWLPAPGPP